MAICHNQHKLFWLVSKAEKRFPERIRLESSILNFLQEEEHSLKPFSSQENETKKLRSKSRLSELFQQLL